MGCKEGMEWQECGSAMIAHCGNKDVFDIFSNFGPNTLCVPGCFCPAGTVFHMGQCKEAKECEQKPEDEEDDQNNGQNGMMFPCGDVEYTVGKEQCCFGTTVQPIGEMCQMEDQNNGMTMPCGPLSEYIVGREQCCFGATVKPIGE